MGFDTLKWKINLNQQEAWQTCGYVVTQKWSWLHWSEGLSTDQ